MPYISRAERAAEPVLTWFELLRHVRDAELCDEAEARRQIANAIHDRALRYRWEDAQPIPSGTGPAMVGGTVYPDDFWLTCEIDPSDPDRVLERRRHMTARA